MTELAPRTSPLLLLAGLVVLHGAACGGAPPAASPEDVAPAVAPAAAQAMTSGPQAVDALTDAAGAFEGERAFEHVRAVVEIGPRVAGSVAIERTRAYIEAQVESYGLTVQREGFVDATPFGEVEFVNLIVAIAPRGSGVGKGDDAGPLSGDAGNSSDAAARTPAVVIAGHYDTKFFEEFEFVGANDAGSSTGLLIEAARALALHPPDVPVWLVFFDGEEAWVQWSRQDGTFGSRYMAARLAAEGRLDEIGALVLVDMIGDAGLLIAKEGNSAKWLTDLIWDTARDLGYRQHFGGNWQLMEDDHIPFVLAGVAAADLIDFDYGPYNRHWHTAEDTLDKVSAASIEVVGRTVLAAVPRIATRLGSGPRR